MHLSPFRYPGAKPKLLARIVPRLTAIEGNYVEPFVGGGSVALAVAAAQPKRRLFLSDADPRIGAFWRIVAEGRADGLWDILPATPTIDDWHSLRNPGDGSNTWRACQALFFNRTCYNGILDSGPIGGLGQRGKYKIGCRYNAVALRAKIAACTALLRDRTEVWTCGFRDVTAPGFVYADPPYYAQGHGLYRERCDHTALRDWLIDRPHWMLSYDDCPEVRALYAGACIEALTVRYCLKNAWRERTELLIRA